MRAYRPAGRLTEHPSGARSRNATSALASATLAAWCVILPARSIFAAEPADVLAARAQANIENCPLPELGRRLSDAFKVPVEVDSEAIEAEMASGRIPAWGGGSTKQTAGCKLELYCNFTGTGRAYTIKTDKEITLGDMAKEIGEAFRWGTRAEGGKLLISTRRKFPPPMKSVSFVLEYAEPVPVETSFMYGMAGGETLPIQDAVRCWRGLVHARSDVFECSYDPAGRKLTISDEDSQRFEMVRKAAAEAVEAMDLPAPKPPMSDDDARALLDACMKNAAAAVGPAEAKAALEAASRLGHEDYQARQKARQTLLAMGPKAMPGIVAAQSSEDPEVQEALREILPEILASDILALAARFNSIAAKNQGKKGNDVPKELLDLATPRMQAYIRRKGVNQLAMPGTKASDVVLLMSRDRAMLNPKTPVRFNPNPKQPQAEPWGAVLYPDGWKIERVAMNVLDLSKR
ncbi:MAG: hypothetical protein N3A38_12630 [Planctomycetota bacterium]|nr:hypothetical protein [Planctomycetota bacterium]